MKTAFPRMDEAGGAADGGAGGGGSGAAGGAPAAGGSKSLLSGGAAAGGAGSDQSGAGGAAGGAAGGGTPDTRPFFADLYGADGKLNKTAFDRLPDHLKGHKEIFAKYETVEALLGGMGNLANLAGRKGLEPLPDNAPPEVKAERDKLLKQLLRVPEKPEGYGIKKPDNIPAELWNEPYMQEMLGTLHKFNASPELVKALVEADTKFAGSIRQQGEQQQAAYAAEQQTKLKETLTAMPGGYDKNLALAVRAARTAGVDPNDAIFADHRVVAMAAKFGSMVAEDRLVSGDGNDAAMGGDDRAKALDIVNNKANPLYEAYHDPNHRQHDEAVRTRSAFNARWLEKQKGK